MALAELLALSADTDGDAGAVAQFLADERHLNAGGTVHGGAIATLVDSAMGMAVNAGVEESQRPVTVNLSINYLEAGKTGPLVATATVRKRGRRLIIVEAEVTQNDDLIAQATGVFTTVTAEQ
ncbi:MAG: thioesterase superfamily protein [Acidimicrobiia bacterium]|nr:thioesterase superfamily protein [Acidimicrobiia bacterium]